MGEINFEKMHLQSASMIALAVPFALLCSSEPRATAESAKLMLQTMVVLAAPFASAAPVSGENRTEAITTNLNLSLVQYHKNLFRGNPDTDWPPGVGMSGIQALRSDEPALKAAEKQKLMDDMENALENTDDSPHGPGEGCVKEIRSKAETICATCIDIYNSKISEQLSKPLDLSEEKKLAKLSDMLQTASYTLRCVNSDEFPRCMPVKFMKGLPEARKCPETKSMALAEEVEDGQGEGQDPAAITNLQFGGAFGGALCTSGSFTMMAASGGF